MIISRVSVQRPVFAIMISAAIIVVGWFSYRQLGLDLMPKVDVPVVNVSVSLPGASAEEIRAEFETSHELPYLDLAAVKRLIEGMTAAARDQGVGPQLAVSGAAEAVAQELGGRAARRFRTLMADAEAIERESASKDTCSSRRSITV